MSGFGTRFGGFGLRQVFHRGDRTGTEWCKMGKWLGWERENLMLDKPRDLAEEGAVYPDEFDPLRILSRNRL